LTPRAASMAAVLRIIIPLEGTSSFCSLYEAEPDSS
jgi:hypothetical protein